MPVFHTFQKHAAVVGPECASFFYRIALLSPLHDAAGLTCKSMVPIFVRSIVTRCPAADVLRILSNSCDDAMLERDDMRRPSASRRL
jgi:hypothetical protein